MGKSAYFNFTVDSIFALSNAINNNNAALCYRQIDTDTIIITTVGGLRVIPEISRSGIKAGNLTRINLYSRLHSIKCPNDINLSHAAQETIQLLSGHMPAASERHLPLTRINAAIKHRLSIEMYRHCF